MGSTIPFIDRDARHRLTARFGGEVEAWFDALPGMLTPFGGAVAVGTRLSDSAGERVGRLPLPHIADGRRAVLKASL